MDIDKLRGLEKEYTEAIATVRDDSASPEAQETAGGRIIELRHQIDRGLMEIEEERQDGERREAIARAADISHRAHLSTGVPDVVAEQRKMESEFVTPGHERNHLWIPMPEARTTGTIVTDDGGAGAYGSYATPTTWWDKVYYHVNAESGVLACNCTVINTVSGENIDVTTLATDASAVHTAQGTAATETIPVHGQKILRSHRMDGFISVAKEFLDDAAIDGVSHVQTLASRAIASLVSTYAANGAGTTEPAGLNYTTEPTTAGKTAAAQTTFTSDEIMDLYLSVLKSSRVRGEFVAGTTAYATMLKWKDDEGRYLITNPTASEGATFMGKPIHEDGDFQATTTGLCPVTFGDMSAFWVRWSRGMDFTRSDDFAFTSYKSTFRFAVWFDCILMDTLAVKHLLMA